MIIPTTTTTTIVIHAGICVGHVEARMSATEHTFIDSARRVLLRSSGLKQLQPRGHSIDDDYRDVSLTEFHASRARRGRTVNHLTGVLLLLLFVVRGSNDFLFVFFFFTLDWFWIKGFKNTT